MNYDFRICSSVDFKDLVRDLMRKEENLHFKAFCVEHNNFIK